MLKGVVFLRTPPPYIYVQKKAPFSRRGGVIPFIYNKLTVS